MIQTWLDKLRVALGSRRYAYRATFKGPLAETVLADLARFCRAGKSTFHPDPHLAAKLDGRREVWLRIQNNLRLSDEQLWALHAPAPVTSTRREDE